MKPFNLARAQAGDPLSDKDSNHLRFIYFDEITRSVIYAYKSGNIESVLLAVAENCVFMAPVNRTLWANMYMHGEWTEHSTQEYADDYDRTGGGVRLGNKAHKIEVEE